MSNVLMKDATQHRVSMDAWTSYRRKFPNKFYVVETPELCVQSSRASSERGDSKSFGRETRAAFPAGVCQ